MCVWTESMKLFSSLHYSFAPLLAHRRTTDMDTKDTLASHDNWLTDWLTKLAKQSSTDTSATILYASLGDCSIIFHSNSTILSDLSGHRTVRERERGQSSSPCLSCCFTRITESLDESLYQCILSLLFTHSIDLYASCTHLIAGERCEKKNACKNILPLSLSSCPLLFSIFSSSLAYHLERWIVTRSPSPLSSLLQISMKKMNKDERVSERMNKSAIKERARSRSEFHHFSAR